MRAIWSTPPAILLDTNVVLDYFLARDRFAATALAVWEACTQGRCIGYVSAITHPTFFYVARKQLGNAGARDAVRELLDATRVCPMHEEILRAAHTLPFADYEDAILHAGATAARLDAIVTRDLADFRGATLPVYSPADFLASLPPVA